MGGLKGKREERGNGTKERRYDERGVFLNFTIFDLHYISYFQLAPIILAHINLLNNKNKCFLHFAIIVTPCASEVWFAGNVQKDPIRN